MSSVVPITTSPRNCIRGSQLWRRRKLCHALIAAAHTSKTGSSLEKNLGVAQQSEGWLNP